LLKKKTIFSKYAKNVNSNVITKMVLILTPDLQKGQPRGQNPEVNPEPLGQRSNNVIFRRNVTIDHFCDEIDLFEMMTFS